MPSSLGPDFRRLWTAFAVSALGSGIGAGALPLVAVLALDASTFQVSLLAALSALAGAAIALPSGAFIEQRHKRPIMIAADLTRFVALGSVPVAALLHLLTYAQLCVVGVLQAAALIVFTSASGAHLKALVPAEGRVEANSRFEATSWTTLSIGPPIGGALVGLVGATVTLAVDAVSFLLSAVGIRRIRLPEPVPSRLTTRPDLRDGWRYILRHRGLRALFWNSQLFGGPVMMTSPLLAVLMLRDLGMQPWQYGVALGVPCLGGVLGARLAPPLTRRFGLHRMLIVFGVLRTPWLLLLPLATPGVDGMAGDPARRDLSADRGGRLQPVVHDVPDGGDRRRLHGARPVVLVDHLAHGPARVHGAGRRTGRPHQSADDARDRRRAVSGECFRAAVESG